MELFTKICISAFVHMIWFWVVISALGRTMSLPCPEIYVNMLRPEFMFFVYPLITNIIVVLTYKINPLETKKEKIIFICTTTFFTVFVLLPWIQ